MGWGRGRRWERTAPPPFLVSEKLSQRLAEILHHPHRLRMRMLAKRTCRKDREHRQARLGLSKATWGNIIATYYRILSPLLRFVPLADLSRRARRLDRGEGFEDLVRVHSTFWHQPGVAGLEKYHLPLQVQLGAALDHVADGLVLARGLGLGLARLLPVPEAHGDRLTGGEVLLSHLSPGRVPRADLFDALVLGHVYLLILEVAACSGWGSYPLPDRLQRSKLVRR